MVTLILSGASVMMLNQMAQADPAPSVSPSPAPLTQAASSIDWSGLIQQLVAAVSGATAHPITSMIGVGVITAVGAILFFIFKAKIIAWLQKLAQIATDKGKTDFVDNNVPTNQVNTNDDNNNRGKIDGAN